MLLPFEIELYYFLRNKVGWFDFIFQDRQDDFEKFDEEIRVMDKEEEKNYRFQIYPDIKRNEFEFIKEIQDEMPEVIIEIKNNQIKELSKELEIILERIEKAEWQGLQSWWIKLIKEIHNPECIVKKIKKLKTDIYFIENRKKLLEEQIDEMDIVRAKEYPMENLIQVDKKGFTCCPFHQESTGSFYIKNNFYYCFGCQESGDTISFIMKSRNLDFIQAIKFLVK